MSDADNGRLRFDGRVAIVTGAGGNPGLGRAYALLLASRGAKVVVNDLGTGPDGRGKLPVHAEAVAQEIVDAGGEAVADVHSVAEESAAKSVVQTALDAYGGVDILINNAGVAILATFDEIASADIEKSIRVHLFGTIWMCRAALPHMHETGNGRIVNIVSNAVLGGRYLTVYGAAKGGILGFTRSLAIEEAERGVRVNCVATGAQTAAIAHNVAGPGKSTVGRRGPEWVAPIVCYLAHEECSTSGKFFRTAGGNTTEIVFAEMPERALSEVSLEAARDELDLQGRQDRALISAVPDPVEMSSERGQTFVPRPYTPV
jgi:NAD(P)-dependent dehydrogenase (short-subunit alcohol dehydrogenase family)